MGAMKDFILHKLTLRICYIAAAFSSAHVIAFASSPNVQKVFAEAGILFHIADPAKLKTYLEGMILIGGEIAYHWTHKKVIMPQVAPKA